MKRLAVALAAIGLTASVGAYAAMPTGAQATEVTVPQEQPGFFLGLTGLYYQPSISGDDLDYADVRSGSGNLSSASLKNVDPGYDLGFAVFGGYDFGNGNDIALSYLRLHTRDTDTTTFASGTGQSVAPARYNGSYESAKGKAEVDLDQVDLIAGQYVNIGCAHKLHLFAGLRYARLDRDLKTDYSANAADPTDHTATGTPALSVDEESNFKGIGPLVGANATYYLGYGIGLVAAADSALLVGKIDDKATGTYYSSATSSFVSTLQTDDVRRVVPVADAKLGLDYTYPFQNYGSLTLEAGYNVSHYWNVVDSVRGSFATSSEGIPAITGHDSASVGYNGPYVTLTYRSTPTA